MEIGLPEFVREDKTIKYSVDVRSANGSRTLWYSVPDSAGDMLSDLSDAPLLALLIPAMASGEDIYIRGAVSERLLYNASSRLQTVFQKVIPSLSHIKIYPDVVRRDEGRRASGVMTGFSGGIDSFCVMADHFYFNVLDGFKVTHLLFNNVGSHGSGGERLFWERYERLRPVAKLLGLPFLAVNSNLDEFYGGEHLGFQQTHTPRNVSVALLLQGGVGRYLYASAYSYDDVFVGPTCAMAYSDTVTLPLMSVEGLDTFSVGSEYSRIEKTTRVAEVYDSYSALDVCVNAKNSSRFTNCATCWKCLRTLATLEIGGHLANYACSFNLVAYKKHRHKYFVTLLDSEDPLLREVVEYAKERRFVFPVAVRLKRIAKYYAIKSLLNHFCMMVKRRR